jgi:hypothetical protein
VGGSGSRCGSDQRAVMALRVATAGRDYQLADWAMSLSGARSLVVCRTAADFGH